MRRCCAPLQTTALSRMPQCAAEPRWSQGAEPHQAPAALGPQSILAPGWRRRGRKTWHACTSVGRPHHASVNVAAVEPITAEFTHEEDVDGEVVSEIADRDSLERIYALSAAQSEVADVPAADPAALDSLLEQVELLGQEADTALSDAMLIPDILNEAEQVSAALGTRPASASGSRRRKSSTQSKKKKNTSSIQDIKLARAKSLRPRVMTPNTRTAAASLSAVPAPCDAADPADSPSTSGRDLNGLRRARTNTWGRSVVVRASQQQEGRQQRSAPKANSSAADGLMRDVQGRLLSFQEEQAIAGRAARYCKVEKKRLELAKQLQRMPTVADLAEHLGTGDVASIEELLVTGKDCKAAMIHANTRLVHSIAKKAWRSRDVQLVDLIDCGMDGLERAVEGFEPERGLKFSTYATWWVKQAVLKAYKSLANIVHVPMHTQSVAARLAHQRSTFFKEHGRFPSTAEIAAHAGLTEERVKEVLATRMSSVSLQAPAGGLASSSGAGELHETIADEADHNPEAVQHTNDAMHMLASAIEQLPERERRVLKLRNGLEAITGEAQGRPGRGRSMTHVSLKAVAQELCISAERARQLERRAMHLLRQAAGPKLQEVMDLADDAERGITSRGAGASYRR